MTMDDAALERLVEMARTGDPEAFGALFDHYHAPVYRYVVSRVGRPSDAEDLTQLVFVKALEALPRYEARGVPFGGWLFRLARNVVIDHIRTRREHVGLAHIVERPSGDDGPDELATLRQEMDSVAAALRRGNVILPSHLPGSVRTPEGAAAASSLPDGVSLAEAVAQYEEGLLRRAIERAGVVKARAAGALGLDPNQMKYLCRKYRL